ncbi:nuclear transport factor 2 family protein [Lysobacter sp. S4-A87]|uniref:nuclear transport factor 2 family protein n=1 Tax=Lysobacter sp. S4-A87 TaxID=2925843 RepID=UPI001F52C12D|nr:nuclear transport factor 2 family protein [Lysobacter sp. S4-A87]UNK48523.1 nuclear transport factor 2 family protein [Lysobacter sp. S4-A87]
MKTEQVAARLVELCRAGKFDEAQRELYADDAVSIEPEGLPAGALGNVKGLAAIQVKSQRFHDSVETFHGVSCSDAVVAGNWFSVAMGVDATFKGMGRVDMREICVYRVRNGKIVHEQFFYDVDAPAA